MTLLVHLAVPLEDVGADDPAIPLSEEPLRRSKSPECREIAKHRLKGTKGNVVILEGLVRGK